MEQSDPSSQGVHLKPEDDIDHDPMDDIQVFSEHLVAISAHLEKSRSALLSSRMGVRFQQDFPRQLHRFLCSRGAEAAIRDYLEHAEDPTYWRSRLVDEYYPDDNSQTFYPAMQLLRAAYQSYTTPDIRRPREVRPVQQLYDPDRTPYEPQHQVSRPAIKDEDKTPSRPVPPASRKGTPSFPVDLGFICPYPGCTNHVSSERAEAGAESCELHAPINLVDSSEAESTSSDSSSSSDSDPAKPPSGPSTPEASAERHPRKRRPSKRAKGDPASEGPRSHKDPPDDSGAPILGDQSTNPSSPGASDQARNAGEEKTPDSPSESGHGRTKSPRSPADFFAIFPDSPVPPHPYQSLMSPQPAAYFMLPDMNDPQNERWVQELVESTLEALEKSRKNRQDFSVT